MAAARRSERDEPRGLAARQHQQIHRGNVSRGEAAKSSVRVGISPFGIWRPGIPATIEAELDAYAQLFADSRKWLAEGWCDYLAPQLYWSIAPPKQSFPVLLDWWRAQSRGRPVWPGLASDRIGASRPAQEIVDQIALTRRETKTPGRFIGA
jgi:uncharacterized lipoprotein YddW (UPF0748 family)